MSLYAVRTVRMKAGKATVRTYEHGHISSALSAFLAADRSPDVERVDLIMDGSGEHHRSPWDMAAWLTEDEP